MKAIVKGGEIEDYSSNRYTVYIHEFRDDFHLIIKFFEAYCINDFVGCIRFY